MDKLLIISLLDTVSDRVFENEEKFLNDLFPVGKGDELLDFYMASDRCKLILMTEEGTTYTTDTVKTSDVIDWVTNL